METKQMSITDFVKGAGKYMDTIWELDLDAETIYVWYDGAWPATQGGTRGLRATVEEFYERYVYSPDKEKWRLAYLPETLLDFVHSGEKTRSFEIRVAGGPFRFEWHEVTWNALPGGEGGHDRILLITKNLFRQRRADIVETAVRSEYDFVIYLEADSNSYVMYMSDTASGTPLPTVVEDDYERGLAEYNSRYVIPELHEELTRSMRMENVLPALERDGEYVLYTKLLEPSGIRDKKLRYSYYDREKRILTLTRTDITEILAERREKELLQDALTAAEVANRAKSEFLSRMSHDIRTPMNAIIGLTAIAGTHVDERDRVRDCLQKITGASKLLLSLINEVLDMSKIESGRIVLSEEPFELSCLFGDLISIIQPDIDLMHHRLDIHVERVVHEHVVGDVQRIQQALMNLLSNAIKYTPAQGHIVVRLTEHPARSRGCACYEFVVEDNGIGMEPDFLNRIFEPFERADDDVVRCVQGTGLGMAISKNIVQMMDGDILVESTPRQGSKFTMTLCLKLGSQESINVGVLADLPVLIADDDPVVCEETCVCLNALGMKCLSVLNGGDAVWEATQAYGRGQNFFAAILDLRLPDMSGIEAMRRIRANTGPDIPIIVISAYDSAEFEIEAQRAGADAFISKPLFQSKLVHLLRRFATRESAVPEAVSAPLVGCDFHGCRVLLAEDNELNREIAVELIGAYGVEVETAENGRAAVELFSAGGPGRYDLIFMDIQMPVMDGYEATHAIRALEPPHGARVPIIAMTANAFAEDVRSAAKAGMDQHMAKPIDIHQLEEILGRWLPSR